MTRILITGANRGIGLALTRHYAQRPENHVLAGCRNPDEARNLYTLAQKARNIRVLELNVTEEDSIEDAVAHVKKQVEALDILINNAGINPPGETQALGSAIMEYMLQTYHVNAIAPFMVTQAFLPLLKHGDQPRIIHVSSDMASIAMHNYGGDYAYCGSKAALNMTARGMAAELAKFGIIVIALDPGWVQTDMGGAHAELTPDESALGMIQVIDRLTERDSGTYLRWNGDTLPW
jgi:NAD(P)-dependent dehydrogenase (short-subunit alcohol dehydrogenase family)